MFGGGARYRRDMGDWSAKADELHERDQKLRERIEAERKAHAGAGDTAARELAAADPDLVLLAKRGMEIEAQEKREREAERQRQREAKRLEKAQAREMARLERDGRRRVLKQMRETGQAPTKAEIKAGIEAQLKAEREQAKEQEQTRPRSRGGPSMGR